MSILYSECIFPHKIFLDLALNHCQNLFGSYLCNVLLQGVIYRGLTIFGNIYTNPVIRGSGSWDKVFYLLKVAQGYVAVAVTTSSSLSVLAPGHS